MTAVALALVRRGERWFLQRRHPGNPILPGLWEFPGGKSEDGEPLLETLARELREETGLPLRMARPWTVIEGAVRLHPFLVDADGDPRTDLAWGWFRAEELRRLPIPPMNQALIERLAQGPLAAELRTGPFHLIG
jgi:8-oxo-dGTP pyrophosphatase MutT (NUDIX family)